MQIKQKDLMALETAKMKFVQGVIGHSRVDRLYNSNVQIVLEVKQFPITVCHKMDWRDHVLHMSSNRILRAIVEYTNKIWANQGWLVRPEIQKDIQHYSSLKQYLFSHKVIQPKSTNIIKKILFYMNICVYIFYY